MQDITTNFATFGNKLCSEELPWFLGLFDFSTAPTLLYYSYVPIVIATLFIGIFVFVNNKTSLKSKLMLAVAVLFSLWVLNILTQWVASYHSALMFAWQMTALIEVALYLSVAYFAYVFYFRKDLPFTWKLGFSAILLMVLVATPTEFNVLNYDIYNCQGNNGLLWNIIYALEPAVIVFTVLLGILAQNREKDHAYRKQIRLVTAGLAVFLTTFFLSNYYGELTKVYEFNFWGPLGMFFFVMLLGYMIVELKAFNVQLLGAQALVLGNILLVFSEFFFIKDTINYILVSGTLLLTIIFGFLLVKSVQREVRQRERIELLAVDLQEANKQQVTLIHFITHQIKGFVTKSRNIFSMALEGDFGPLPEQLKPMIEEGFRSDTKGVTTIQEILNAANIKSGKVTYAQAPFDLKELVEEIIKDLKPAADTKSLALSFETTGDSFTFTGDRQQMYNALKNLVDNSIKYTPSGTVSVALAKETNHFTFTIKDTGIGITPEDMAHLFTEGGHGKESIKVNVESTGFGLYIVKNIIDAHKGKVWAESEGAGKGSKFVVELPA